MHAINQMNLFINIIGVYYSDFQADDSKIIIVTKFLYYNSIEQVEVKLRKILLLADGYMQC